MKNLIFLLLCFFVLSSCTSGFRPALKAKKTQYDNSNLLRATLNYRVPNSWQRVQPSSPMRVDELLVDPVTQTSLTVFVFPNTSDLVQSNLERWSSQFKSETLKKNFEQYNSSVGLPITVFEANGTFIQALDPMNPSAGAEEKENFKMLAAIVELKDGAWFFKLIGPEQIIDMNKDKFQSLLDSLEPVR